MACTPARRGSRRRARRRSSLVVHRVGSNRDRIEASEPVTEPFRGHEEITSKLRDSAQGIQRTTMRYEALLEFRRRQIDHAVAITQPALRTETLRDALAGYAAEVERLALELQAFVERFGAAALDLQSSYKAYAAWCAAHPRQHAGERRKHIDRLKMARMAIELIAAAEGRVRVSEVGSIKVRQALRRYRAVLDRYGAASKIVERFSVEALRLLGVDAASLPADRDGRTR